MSFTKHMRFPTYDSPKGHGENGHTTIDNDISKRVTLFATKLPKWGPKGATLKMIQATCNKLVGVNFADTHVQYGLKWLVDNNVIGKRSDGEEAVYFAYPTTSQRLATALKRHRKAK